MPKYDARQEIEELRNGFTELRGELGELRTEVREMKINHFPHLEAKVDLLMEKVSGRPSWLVTTLITLLSGLCILLATLLASTLR